MKIVWARQFSKRGIGIADIVEMPNNLLKFKHEIILVLPKSCRSIIIENFKTSKIGFVFLPQLDIKFFSRITFSFSVLFYITYLVKKEKIDFAIFNGGSILGSFGIILWRAIGFKGPYLILDDRSPPVETRGIFGYLDEKQYEISYMIAKHFFDGITVITSTLKDKICKDFLLEEDKVGVWSSGVSPIFYKYISNWNEKELKEKFDLQNKFVIMYHGVYTQNRGLQETIEAMKILEEYKDRITLLLLGNGPIRDELKRLVKDKGLEGNVIFIDEVSYEKVPMYIYMCNVGIIPLPPNNSWWRVSAPLKTLEFLAMEKPIIATNIPFHEKIFGKGNCGKLLSSNNPNEIAEAILNMYKNKDNLVEIGRIGKRIVVKDYTWESKARELERFIKQISKR